VIGRLSGTIAQHGADHVLLDVRGVGYVVHVSERTLRALPGTGEPAMLYTDLVVREDLMQLFGFPTLHEKEWHGVLTSVQGVGARAALAILGALGPDGVARAIALGDGGALRKAPGVGPKLAQRIAHELRDKAPALMAADSAPAAHPAAPAPEPATPAPAPVADPAAAPQHAAAQPHAGSAVADAM